MDAKQARAEAKAAGGRLWRAVLVLLGARVTAGVACLFVIAFGMAVLVSPQRLPPVGAFSVVQLGLPPLELGKEKDVLGDIVGAARRQGGEEKARSFFQENPLAARIANWTGLVFGLVILAWGVYVQSRLWRRGVRPF
jgi:hypothetical protein